MTIRHKMRLTQALTPENTAERSKIPAAFETIVAFFNHSELNHINQIALAAGVSQRDLPFKKVESLPADNGERFFFEYLVWMKDTNPSNDMHGRCLCKLCGTAPGATAPLRPQECLYSTAASRSPIHPPGSCPCSSPHLPMGSAACPVRQSRADSSSSHCLRHSCGGERWLPALHFGHLGLCH